MRYILYKFPAYSRFFLFNINKSQVSMNNYFKSLINWTYFLLNRKYHNSELSVTILFFKAVLSWYNKIDKEEE